MTFGSRISDRHDNLADLLVGFEVAVGFDDFLAIWMAARRTLIDAAGITIVSPFVNSAMSIKDFAFTGRRDLKFLDLQNLWAAGLMKSHDFGHVLSWSVPSDWGLSCPIVEMWAMRADSIKKLAGFSLRSFLLQAEQALWAARLADARTDEPRKLSKA